MRRLVNVRPSDLVVRVRSFSGLSGGCQCGRLMVVFVLLVSLFLLVPFDPGQQVLEVGRGELPFERLGGGVVALFEDGEPVLDRSRSVKSLGETTLRCTMEKKTWLSQEACTGVWIMTMLG